jgi:hypothetical protein
MHGATAKKKEFSLFGFCNYISSCRFEVYRTYFCHVEIEVKSSVKFFKLSIKVSRYVMSIVTEVFTVTYTRCRFNTIDSPDNEHGGARNM